MLGAGGCEPSRLAVVVLLRCSGGGGAGVRGGGGGGGGGGVEELAGAGVLEDPVAQEVLQGVALAAVVVVAAVLHQVEDLPCFAIL